MKSNLLFSLLVAGAMTVGSAAWTVCNASVTVTKASPFTENFEGSTTVLYSSTNFYNLPSGWTRINNSSFSGFMASYFEWLKYTPCEVNGSGRSSSKCALFWLTGGQAPTGDHTILVFPDVTNDVKELALKFYVASANSTGTVKVGVMTSATDAGTFTEVSSFTTTLNQYQQQTVNFSTYTGSGKYIAIKGIRPSTGDFQIAIDDVELYLATSTVNAAANSEGYGYVEKICQAADTTADGTFYDGKTVTLVAHANPGYEFVNWSNGTTTDTLTLVVSSDVTLTANFAPTYRVFALANNPSMGSVTGSGVQTAGQVTLTATATEHYHFVDWNNGSTDAQLTIDLQSDTAIVATFAIDRHNVSATPNDRKLGYITGDFGDWDYGTEVTLQANPMNEHVTFTGWSDGSNENPRAIVLDKDVELTANFVLDQYNVTATAGEGGTVSGGGTYDYGTMVTILATPSAGYYFVDWSNGKTCEEISIYVVEDSTITANFQADMPSANAQPYSGRTEQATSKYVRNGNLYIRNGEAIYDAKGAKVE